MPQDPPEAGAGALPSAWARSTASPPVPQEEFRASLEVRFEASLAASLVSHSQ